LAQEGAAASSARAIAGRKRVVIVVSPSPAHQPSR
jgi:hypothetical protein